MKIKKILFPEEISYIDSVVTKFCNTHAVPYLAEVVMELFRAALRPSSQRTYRSGQRAYSRFVNTLQGGIYFPFNSTDAPWDGTKLGVLHGVPLAGTYYNVGVDHSELLYSCKVSISGWRMPKGNLEYTILGTYQAGNTEHSFVRSSWPPPVVTPPNNDQTQLSYDKARSATVIKVRNNIGVYG